MPSNVHAKKLLVEGNTDKRVIPYLIEANGITWEPCGQHLVHIDQYGGVDELVKPGVFSAEQDEPGRQLHQAVAHRIFDPEGPQSKPFVEWFRELFEL